MKTKIVTTVLELNIYNNSSHIVKLYSIFPGTRDRIINKMNTKFIKNDYTYPSDDEKGVWMKVRKPFVIFNECECGNTIQNTGELTSYKLQGGNQFITFRIKDVNSDQSYYAGHDNDTGPTIFNSPLNKYMSYYTDDSKKDKECVNTCAYIYPLLSREYDLCVDSNKAGNCIKLNPGESISVPIAFEYHTNENEYITKYMSFDLRPSLYQDPITYTFGVTAKYQATPADRVLAALNQPIGKQIKYNNIVSD
jgi:hypothetical protein